MSKRSEDLPRTHWTTDPVHRERLLNMVDQTITHESKRFAGRYGIWDQWGDVAGKIRLEYVETMGTDEPSHPFDVATPEGAAAILIDNNRINERARTITRGIIRKESRQARLLKNVDEPTCQEDRVAQLMEIAHRVSEMAKNPALTNREGEAWRLEASRQVGLDDLDDHRFDEACQVVGVAPKALRNYINNHEENGHASAKDRQAWSRAKRKVATTLSRLGVITFLILLVEVSSALAHQHQGF